MPEHPLNEEGRRQFQEWISEVRETPEYKQYAKEKAMENKKLYGVIVVIDDDNGIVNVTSIPAHMPGKMLSFETAWLTNNDQQAISHHADHQPYPMVIHPVGHHKIMTYDDRDEAIGEAMTSLRDHIDNDERYR